MSCLGAFPPTARSCSSWRLAVVSSRARPARAGGERSWTASGYGETKNDAQHRALENARGSVQDYLDRKFHDLGWSPSTGDLVRLGVVRVDEPKPGTFGDLNGYEGVAHIDLTDPNLRKMQVEV